MTESEATDLLSAMVAADSEPTLDGVEIKTLLDTARRVDTDGLEITAAHWTPTWDLSAAAAAGWRWKAGKVAGDFAFGADGQSFQRDQVLEHCLNMAKVYAGRTLGSIPTGPHAALVSDTIVNVND